MHNIEVLLVVAAPNPERPGHSSFLLVEQDGELRLPSSLLSPDSSTVGVAASLLHKHTKLQAKWNGGGWVDLVPVPLVDSPARAIDGSRIIGVPYGCIVPAEHCEVSEAKWVTLDEIFERGMFMDHLEVLTAAANHI